jgi:hypothetical protein
MHEAAAVARHPTAVYTFFSTRKRCTHNCHVYVYFCLQTAADIDPAELEFVEEISADDARDIALALEDLVSGTVTNVDAIGVTVSYTLEDGSTAEVRG